MKGYQGLYPQHSMSRIPTVNSHIQKPGQRPVVMRGKKPLVNSIAPKKHIEIRERLSRSIEELPQFDSGDKIVPLFMDRKSNNNRQARFSNMQGDNFDVVENCEEIDTNSFFTKSYDKLSTIHSNIMRHKAKPEIEEELEQILNLIKEERMAIKDKLSTPKKTFVESSQNTDPILPVHDEK